jgi:hypothetical protein
MVLVDSTEQCTEDNEGRTDAAVAVEEWVAVDAPRLKWPEGMSEGRRAMCVQNTSSEVAADTAAEGTDTGSISGGSSSGAPPTSSSRLRRNDATHNTTVFPNQVGHAKLMAQISGYTRGRDKKVIEVFAGVGAGVGAGAGAGAGAGVNSATLDSSSDATSESESEGGALFTEPLPAPGQ